MFGLIFSRCSHDWTDGLQMNMVQPENGEFCIVHLFLVLVTYNPPLKMSYNRHSSAFYLVRTPKISMPSNL
jgi:hypothetical protein